MSLVRTRRTWALAALTVALVACVSAHPKPVPLAKVDLEQVYGGWYIVATMPNMLERGVIESYDHFAPRPRGIREDYYMRRGGFERKRQHFTVDIDVHPGSNNADWRVRLMGPVRLPFQVLWVDPDGRFLLFGEQDRNWGWIYSRQPRISDEDYAAMLGRFAALGYDTTRFRRTVQFPEQIGRSGFWSDGVHRSTSAAAPG